jgi:hypothetical protein
MAASGARPDYVIGSGEGNPYEALISGFPGDGCTANGFIRIEPPVTISERFFESATENYGVNFEPFATDTNATLVKWSLSKYDNPNTGEEIVDERLKELHEEVQSATQQIVDALGYVASRERFLFYTTATGEIKGIN